jgi:type II secretory pathway pseudopilin PulG
VFKRIFIMLGNLSPATIREIIVIIIILCISIALSLPQLKEDMEKAKTMKETDSVKQIIESIYEGEAGYGIIQD